MALSAGPRRPRWRRRKVFRSGPRVLEKTAAPAVGDLDVAELAARGPEKLHELAAALGIDAPDSFPRIEIIHRILTAHVARGGRALARGAFYRLVEGFGFLRPPIRSYLPGPNDVYVSAAQIRRFGLRDGDMLHGEIRRPRSGERYFGLADLLEVNGAPAETHPERVEFESLVALHPDRMIRLENGREDLAARIVDLVAPIGVGQRGLIVAPPRAGKTVMLQSIANAIKRNHPDMALYVLLVDERPEEVSDMTRNVGAEVLSSTFDERGSRHIQVAESLMSRARRQVELGRDVVILLDSLTRLARAYNHSSAASEGRLLSGGMDANAIQHPKRFFGAARNVEDGGSLTILATALVDTGSRLDDLVYEEFKGTGNLEIHLSQELLEKRLFPAIDIHQSGTRREEMLLTPEEHRRMTVLRRVVSEMEPVDAMELVIDRMKATDSNAHFLDSMAQQGGS